MVVNPEHKLVARLGNVLVYGQSTHDRDTRRSTDEIIGNDRLDAYSLGANMPHDAPRIGMVCSMARYTGASLGVSAALHERVRGLLGR